MATDSVRVQFSASIGALISGVAEAKTAINSVRESTDRVTEGAKSLLEAFGVGFSVDKIAEFVNQMGDLGERTQSVAAILGVSTQEVGRLDAIAKGAGTTTDSLAHSFETFQLNLQHAQNSTSLQAAALRSLGLSAKDFVGLPLTEQVNKFADAISKFSDGGNKVAVVRELFGRLGTELIPLFDKGAEGFNELAAMADRAGTTLSSTTAAAFETTHLKLTELGLSVEGVGIKLFSVLSPAIDQAATALTKWIESIKVDDIRGAVEVVGNASISIAEAVATFFIQAGGSIDQFKLKLDSLKPTLDVRLTGAAAAVYRFVQNINAPLTDIVAKIREEWNKPIVFGGGGKVAATIEDIGKQLAAVKTAADEARKALTAVVGGGSGGGGGPFAGAPFGNQGLPQVPSFGGGADAKAQLADQVKALNEAIQTENQAFQSEVEQINAAAKTFRISEEQKTAALIAAVNARVAVVESEIQKEIDLYKSAGKNYTALTAEMTKVAQKGAEDIRKFQDQAAERTLKDWEAALAPLEQAWNSQLQKLLSGSETFGTAMKKITADIVIDMIKEFEKLSIYKPLLNMLSGQGGGV